MGLFDKKYCDICGEKIGFLGNRKLEDGNLCKACAGKLSPLFRERRNSTVEEIRAQLAYRAENAEKLKSFQPRMIFGTDEKIYLDLTAKQLIVTAVEDFTEDNPDIIDASQIISFETEIEDNEEELFFTDKEGNEKSYNPPKYQYAYEFHITLKIDSPWFDEIRVDLNNGERPDDKESELYVKQQMKLSELVSIINRWIHPECPEERSMGIPTEKDDSLSDSWKCSCGTVNSGKFCEECGKPRTL